MAICKTKIRGMTDKWIRLPSVAMVGAGRFVSIHHVLRNVFWITEWTVAASASIRAPLPTASSCPVRMVWTRTIPRILSERLLNEYLCDLCISLRDRLRERHPTHQEHHKNEKNGTQHDMFPFPVRSLTRCEPLAKSMRQ